MVEKASRMCLAFPTLSLPHFIAFDVFLASPLTRLVARLGHRTDGTSDVKARCGEI